MKSTFQIYIDLTWFLGPDSEADYKNVDDLCNLPEAVRSSIDRHKPKKRDLTYQFVSYF